MTIKTLFYVYILGGITFIPLVILGAVLFTIYTSVPIQDVDPTKASRGKVEVEGAAAEEVTLESDEPQSPPMETNDVPRTRKGWLTMRRTFEETNLDGSYVTMVRSFLDARSKDPKRSRPKDMWYVVLKGKVLYLYEDEEMTECEAAIELSGHDVVIYPEGLLDGELFTKRNGICLKPKAHEADKYLPSVTKDMKFTSEDINAQVEQAGGSEKREQEREKLLGAKEAVREEAFNLSTPWFIFVRSIIEMEDWYFALIHASDHPTKTPTLTPLQAVFQAVDMNHLVTTLDEQPDVIPMRWLNALIGRVFFSYYRTHKLEAYIIGRLMKKLSKVKRPTFLTDIVVTEVSVGNNAPTFSKPMLKELTKEGEASLEVHLHYKGEFRITIEATALISLGTFKSYTVKLALAAVLKELEGNLLIKVKRPPSNRIWYAFTQTPRMVLAVEPIVSDRQITWSMILGTIESRVKEIIQESVVMPNMDDIAFFDSQPYQHRGGIWQDASRRVKKPSLAPEQTPDEPQSTVLAVAPDAPPTITSQEPSFQLRSQSTEELPTDLRPSSPTPSNGILADVTAQDSPVPLRINNRRRSWFSSVRSENHVSLSRHDSDVEEAADSHEQRGRAPDTGKEAANSPRSQSTPHAVDSSAPVSPAQEREDPYLNAHLSPQSAQRSSPHSSKREHGKSKSIDSSDTLPDTAKSTPSKTSGNTSNPSSPNSFLSTLKSRAVDKQALSNNAKEAMRKWGVNWASLRKDSSIKSTSDDASSDHGSIGSLIGSRLQSDGHSSVAHRTRASYAEVRAAVEERKGRDKTTHSRSPSPIPMPGAPTDDAAGSSLAGTPQASDPSSFPDTITKSYSSASASSSHLSTGETSNLSRKSSTGLSRTLTESDTQDRPEPLLSPMHVVQPQAKMMTIPGIHASHRGEIMSMGYSAPQAQQESKPSKQSVYRLWKSPPLSGQERVLPQSHQSQDPSPNIDRDSGERDRDSTPVIPTPSASSPPHAPPRPVPPPLPPRSTPVAISRPPLETSLGLLSESSASQTLKSIANKDEQKRASVENGFIPLAVSRVDTDTDPFASTTSPDSAHSDHSPTNTPIAQSNSITNPGPPLPPRPIPT